MTTEDVRVLGTVPVPEATIRPAGRLRADLRAVEVLWKREMLRLRRNPMRLAMGLLTPLLFLIVLGTGITAAGGSGDGFRQFRTFLFPGVLLMALQAPTVAVGVAIVWDRQAGFLRQMLVAPVRRGAVLAGIILGGATTGAVYGGLVLTVAGVAGIPYRPSLLLVLAELALISAAFTALGVLAAVSFRRIETFQMVVSLCMMPLVFLSGAIFPANGLPGWLGIAVRINPLTYVVDLLRRTLPGPDVTLGGRPSSPQWWGWVPPVGIEALGITLIAVVALALAARRFARSD
ncbi:ABC transporter permease [Actinoplanes sp. NPDC049596]|uniref:ABC transporter permease n=1 Tax=unclassified Actinoplanes TaxID=2626549 RepID=UPI00344186A8